MSTQFLIGTVAKSLSSRGPRRLFVAVVALVLTGCVSTHRMMPTPVLYTGPQAKPLFTDLPADRRAPSLDLLFITDRAQANNLQEGLPYTAARAHSMAFGSTTTEFGETVSWDTLVKQSTTVIRTVPIDLHLGHTKELGRFPSIPYDMTVTPSGISRAPAIVDAHERAKHDLQTEIARRLSISPRKEIVLYVHGYNSTFEDAALTMGELCHFLGRDFVCGIFSWPAGGRRGILFGYNVDRESGEFAVEHLLKAIRAIAGTPGLEKIHLLAHSRGTDVIATALSELSVEAYILQSTLARRFKIGNVFLMAPDIDADVALSKIYRIFSDPDVPFGRAPNPRAMVEPSPDFHVTVYVSPDDKALAASTWLFGSIARFGRIGAAMLNAEQIERSRRLGFFDVIEVRGTTDFFGHGYFVSNPQVSADIIALLRYGIKANEPGRPLEEVARPFWRVHGTADRSAATQP